MAIKWDNISVVTSPLSNNIYLARLDKNGVHAVDKSEDRTSEVISTVMAHMDAEVKDGNVGIAHVSKAGSLEWIRTGAPTREALFALIEDLRKELRDVAVTTNSMQASTADRLIRRICATLEPAKEDKENEDHTANEDSSK